MKTFIEPITELWDEIVRRPVIHDTELKKIVSTILLDVKQHGDNALKKYCAEFDGIILEDLKVSEDEMLNASSQLTEALKAAIEVAYKNIEKFHIPQLQAKRTVETMAGVKCWQMPKAIEKVGLYIPGGSAPLFSSVLMLGIPAKIAGCKDIVICTPPNQSGKIAPAILYIAQLLGISEVYKVGGAQAIGAMAYGTASIPKVHKIFGPGNQYVTAAKQLVNTEGIAIDMPAGPSEVAIYADETSNPSFVAADLLSQAEHGADSQVLLIASSPEIIAEVKSEINLQAPLLRRNKIIEGALQKSVSVVLKDVSKAFELLNKYAPEHLIIATNNAVELSGLVINAGSVFLGHYAPESVGDYASGTNHTLPTNGYATTYSGVSVDSFVKKITFQQLSKEGIFNIGRTVEIMAEAEGLDAHKSAVTIRLKSLKGRE